MKLIRILFFVAVAVSSLGWSSVTRAGLVEPPIGSPIIFSEQAARLSYDPTLQLFGAIASSPFAVRGSGLSFAATDIVSTFTLSANIDTSGQLLNGSFSVFGQSATLGIASSTKLLSGDLFGVGGFYGQISPGVSVLILQLYATNLFINDAIADLTGSFPRAVIDFFAFPPAFGNDGLPDFLHGYSNTTADSSPDIYLVSSIPEPESLVVFAAAVLAWMGTQFSRGRAMAKREGRLAVSSLTS